MKGRARHFPMIVMLVPGVLRRRQYQHARRRCDALAQMLATRADIRTQAFSPARALQRHLAVIEGSA
jgi:hypothetical protein